MLGSVVLEMVWGSVPAVCASISEVTDRLAHGTETRRRIDPSHCQDQGDGYHGFFSRIGWENHCQARGMIWAKHHAVESVFDVVLCHVDGTVLGIGVPYHVEDAVEGTTELHGLLSGVLDSMTVNAEPGMVNDESRSTGAFLLNPQRGQT